MRETKRTVWFDERVAGSGRGLDSPGDQGSPRRSREIRLFHVWLILAGKVNECNCTGTSFLLLPFSSSSSFSSYFPTPTLSFFSRAPIVALTYHTHAYRIEKRLEVTLPFLVSSFLSLSFFSFFFFWLHGSVPRSTLRNESPLLLGWEPCNFCRIKNYLVTLLELRNSN